MLAPMRVAPVPVPLLVMVPVLLMLASESVRLLAVDVLLFSMRLPIPVTPPLIVKLPSVFVKVLPLLPTLIAPETVNAELLLF